MRISVISTIFVGFATTLATLANAKPTSPGVAGLATAIRKEVREMSEDEWTTYAGAVKLVQASGFWQSMADLHRDNFRRGIHRNPVFFPWHRAYLRMMEEELSAVAGTTVTIPYWDWTLDSADMNGSPIFGSTRFGGFSSDRSGCVTDGSFKTLTTPASLGGDRCLRRGSSYRGNGYDRVAVLKRFLDYRGNAHVGDKGYDEVRYGIEMVHNSVHSSISGDMGGASSPLDPIFWSHHMMIDNLWSVWQSQDPANVRAYDGKASDFLMDLANYTVADTFNIRPFKPLEDEVARVANMASRFALHAGAGMDPVEFSTTSESVEMLNALGSMNAEQLDRVPRTCAAPLRNSDNEMFWDAEGEQPIIQEMEARFKLAQDLGLEQTLDCLASAEVIQRLIDEDKEQLKGNVDSAGLGAAETAGIAGSLGLMAVVAGLAMQRRNQQSSADEVQQHQLAAGEAFPDL